MATNTSPRTPNVQKFSAPGDSDNNGIEANNKISVIDTNSIKLDLNSINTSPNGINNNNNNNNNTPITPITPNSEERFTVPKCHCSPRDPAYKTEPTPRKRRGPPSTPSLSALKRDLANRKKNINYAATSEEDKIRAGSMLRTAIIHDDYESFKFYLNENQADPDGGNSRITPLYTAVDLNAHKFCKQLLLKGASMVYQNEKEDNNECALQLAMKSNDKRVVDLFLDRVRMLEEHYKNTIDVHELSHDNHNDDEGEAGDLPIGKKRKMRRSHDF